MARTLKTKMISASFKMFRTKKLKSKTPAYSRDFCPNPPVIGGKSYGRREGASQKLLKVTENFGSIRQAIVIILTFAGEK